MPTEELVALWNLKVKVSSGEAVTASFVEIANSINESLMKRDDLRAAIVAVSNPVLHGAFLLFLLPRLFRRCVKFEILRLRKASARSPHGIQCTSSTRSG